MREKSAFVDTYLKLLTQLLLIYILFSKFYFCSEFFFLTIRTMKKVGDDFDRFSQANHALTLQNELANEDYFTFWWGMKDEVTQCCICDIRVLLKSEGS